jgi:hypothetical protein
MHDVAPSAVTIAVAILAIICTMNLMVSLFVIFFNVSLGFAAWLRQELLMLLILSLSLMIDDAKVQIIMAQK